MGLETKENSDGHLEYAFTCDHHGCEESATWSVPGTGPRCVVGDPQMQGAVENCWLAWQPEFGMYGRLWKYARARLRVPKSHKSRTCWLPPRHLCPTCVAWYNRHPVGTRFLGHVK